MFAEAAGGPEGLRKFLHIRSLFGMDGLCEVIVIENEAEVSAYFPDLPAWAIGFHRNDTIFLKSVPLWPDAEVTDLFSLFLHEFVHVCTWRMELPLWLYEGLAVVFAGQLAGHVTEPPPADLEHFGYDHPDFYPISGNAVQALLEHHDQTGVLEQLGKRDVRYWNRLLRQTLEQTCVKTTIA